MNDQADVIRRAHELDMHDDGYFHVECPLCVESATISYLIECCTILRHIYRDQLQASFCAYVRGFSGETMACVLHDEPVYVVADFLGVHGLGDALEDDSFFQIIESAAKPLREQRLRRDDTG